MRIAKIFLLSIAGGFLLMFALVFADSRLNRGNSDVPVAALNDKPLRDGVFVRDQIALADIAAIKAHGYKTLVNLRPDGEEANQPASAQVGAAAIAQGLAFLYLPTPHGEIPASIPDTLAKELATAQRPVLLYCRSGKRAARVWALAEATRAEGASVEEISAAVSGAGQTVEDLMPQIQSRIASRAPVSAQGPSEPQNSEAR